MSSARSLRELLARASELTIVCHNNPDPDCLASALALGRIAAAAGIDERHIFYSGDISHQQNRAFVNLIDVDLELHERRPETARRRRRGRDRSPRGRTQFSRRGGRADERRRNGVRSPLT